MEFNNLSLIQNIGSTCQEQFIEKTTHIIEPQIYFFIMVLIYVVSIIVHELTHYFVLKKYDRNCKIEFFYEHKELGTFCGVTSEIDVPKLKRNEKVAIYTSGLLGGGLFIIISSFFIGSGALLLLLPHIYGSRLDLKAFYTSHNEK